jgi:hypothetical protein
MTDVSEAVADLAITTWSAASPRALVHGEVIAITTPQADEGVSSVLGMVAASTDHPLGRFWVDPYRPNVLGGLASPRG